MPQLKSYIEASHRPEIYGARLDSTHQTKFHLNITTLSNLEEIWVNTIVFGPKKDRVLLNLEHALSRSDAICIFYYEDLHKKWSFVQTNHDRYFIYQQNAHKSFKIRANCLYIRGCQIDVDDEYWEMLGEFYNFVDCWDGKVLCAPKNQNNNESKLYQLSHSLRASCRNAVKVSPSSLPSGSSATTGSLNYATSKPQNIGLNGMEERMGGANHTISIGKSYVIKGINKYEQLPKNKTYIVKSLSGIRSIVVENKEFNKWNRSSINNLPVLFQEKVSGNDLRVHIVNGKVYGKLSLGKLEVDYRYDNNFFSLQDFHDISEELKQFCIEVTKFEGNPLMGIDFIKSEMGYVVLEANPSPGWSAYHECNGIENDAFMDDLLMELKTATNVFSNPMSDSFFDNLSSETIAEANLKNA